MNFVKYIMFGTILLPLGLCGGTPSPASPLESGQAQAYIQHHFEMVVQRRPISEKVCHEKVDPVMNQKVEECHRESRYKEDRGKVYTHSTVTFWDSSQQKNITLEYQR